MENRFSDIKIICETCQKEENENLNMFRNDLLICCCYDNVETSEHSLDENGKEVIDCCHICANTVFLQKELFNFCLSLEDEKEKTNLLTCKECNFYVKVAYLTSSYTSLEELHNTELENEKNDHTAWLEDNCASELESD